MTGPLDGAIPSIGSPWRNNSHPWSLFNKNGMDKSNARDDGKQIAAARLVNQQAFTGKIGMGIAPRFRLRVIFSGKGVAPRPSRFVSPSSAAQGSRAAISVRQTIVAVPDTRGQMIPFPFIVTPKNGICGFQECHRFGRRFRAIALRIAVARLTSGGSIPSRRRSALIPRC